MLQQRRELLRDENILAVSSELQQPPSPDLSMAAITNFIFLHLHCSRAQSAGGGGGVAVSRWEPLCPSSL